MNRLFTLLSLLLVGVSATAQTQSASTTPPTIVTVVEGVTGKSFQPDTTYSSLSEEDATLLAKEPIANWSLAQESGQMVYYNLVVGTRSYQLVVIKPPKEVFPKATLIRFMTPKSKPEPIARGALKPKEEKPK